METKGKTSEKKDLNNNISLGLTLELRRMLREDVQVCAKIACAGKLREAYGFTVEIWRERLNTALHSTEDILFVAEQKGAGDERTILGFFWASSKGAFMSAPYLRFIAVNDQSRGSGVGSALLKQFEQETAYVGRDFFLLVSDFNDAAAAFYEKHGYRCIGILTDFVKKGISETIMVKKFENYGQEV